MSIKGSRVLEILKELEAPASPEQIAAHLALFSRKPYKKILNEVNAALIGGKRFGYLDYCNGYYYNIKHTEELFKQIENEESQKKISATEISKTVIVSDDSRCQTCSLKQHGIQTKKHKKVKYRCHDRRAVKKPKTITIEKHSQKSAEKTAEKAAEKTTEKAIEKPKAAQSFALKNVKINCQSTNNLETNKNIAGNLPIAEQDAFVVECEIKNALQDIITKWKCSHSLLSISHKEEQYMNIGSTIQPGKMVQLTWQSRTDPNQKLITSHKVSSNSNEVESNVELSYEPDVMFKSSESVNMNQNTELKKYLVTEEKRKRYSTDSDEEQESTNKRFKQ